jgi:hypothetical protein
MKWLRRLLVVVFCGPLIISSCFNPPEYPDIPEIVFKSVDYVKGSLATDGSQNPDSIILKLTFKDGDGDIGIATDELYPPFNDRWFITKSKLAPDLSVPEQFGCAQYDNKCYYIDPRPAEFAKYVDYKDRRATPAYDTLVPYVKPYDCYNWEVVYQDDDNDPQTPAVVLDTLFFVLNPHYNNLFVEFEMKTDDLANPFETFDEKTYFTATCGVRVFYGRIPILSEDLGRSTPLEGEIRYAIPSLFYTTIFGAKTLRLKVYIEDRALHRSNTIYTREFNLLENQ